MSVTAKSSHWIASVTGQLALVEGADERDVWTKVRGWTEVTEPRPADQVWIWRDDVDQPGRVPFAALDDWLAMGWRPGPPPGPVDITKDPVLRDQPAEAEPVEPKPTSAAGGEKIKE